MPIEDCGHLRRGTRPARGVPRFRGRFASFHSSILLAVLVAILTRSACAALTGDARWASMSVNGYVYALATDKNGNVYVGGQFTLAGNVSAQNIAKWDGSSWSALGSVPGPIYVLAVDASGNLYAGGRTLYVYKWDGTSWSALGGAIGQGSGNWGNIAEIWALAVDGVGNVYAGGTFGTIGSLSAHGVAKWNGSSWSALGLGVNNSGSGGLVFALAVDGGNNVYVGGSFESAGGVTAVYNIAKWNGASWSALIQGYGISGTVWALALDGSGNLYAGGNFGHAGYVSAYDIAKWNGSLWSPVGSGMNNEVHALAVDGSGNLYAGGAFTTAGGVTVHNVARWNGSSWSALGSGVGGNNPFVAALAVKNSGSLYAGGMFTTAGNKSSNYIANWVNTAPTNTALPVVTGTYLIGQQLSASTGNWTDAEGDGLTYSYQWQRANDASGTNTTNIGTNSSGYTLAASTAHRYIRVTVTANDGNGGLTAVSTAWVRVWNSAPVNTAAPVVSGTNAVGGTLTTTNGAWTDADGDTLAYTYQWQRAIDGSGTFANEIGTNSGCTLTWFEAHQYIRVTVTANDGNGGKTAASTAWVQVGDGAPVNTATPEVDGTYTVGGDLLATFGNWTDADRDELNYSFQWLRAEDATGTNAATIAGATANSYPLMAADAQKYVCVQVTADDGYGGVASAQSSFAVCNAFGPLAQFALALSSQQTNGVAFTGANRLTAQDAFGNTVTTFDAAADNVTIVANAPLVGDAYGLGTGNNNVLNRATDFVAGVADLTALGMVFVGNYATGTFTATSATGKSGTSGSVTINGPGPGQPGKDMQVVVWLTIPKSVPIAWGEGTTGKTAGDVTPLDWTVKDAGGDQLGLSETCVSNDDKNNMAMKIENMSNTGTNAKVSAAVTGNGGWSMGSAPATDTFVMQAQLGGNAPATLAVAAQELTGTTTLARGADQALVLTVMTPTDITHDAGVAKPILVTLTATPE